jgi:hypothetical protein
MYNTLASDTGYFMASIEDIMHETGDWDNRRWHEELSACANTEVLEAYVKLRAYDPYIYTTIGRNAEAADIKERAVRAMRSHLDEQMNPRNWADKWWLK